MVKYSNLDNYTYFAPVSDEEIADGANQDKVTDITAGLVKAAGNLLQAILNEPNNNLTSNTSVETPNENSVQGSSKVIGIFYCISLKISVKSIYVGGW